MLININIDNTFLYGIMIVSYKYKGAWEIKIKKEVHLFF